jgi:hypothetical protein
MFLSAPKFFYDLQRKTCCTEPPRHPRPTLQILQFKTCIPWDKVPLNKVPFLFPTGGHYRRLHYFYPLYECATYICTVIMYLRCKSVYKLVEKLLIWCMMFPGLRHAVLLMGKGVPSTTFWEWLYTPKGYGGHYTAFVRSQVEPSQWLHANDHQVPIVSFS